MPKKQKNNSLSNTDPKSIQRPKLLEVPKAAPKIVIKKESTAKKERRGSSRAERSVANAYFSEKEIGLFGNDDPIELEGDLYRFKPGVNHSFITRWV